MQGDLHALRMGFGAGLAPSPVGQTVPLGDAMTAFHLNEGHLQEASARLAAAATTGDEQGRRQKLVDEWNAWASPYPASVRPSLQWCTPTDVAVFLGAWRKEHRGRWRKGEDCPVAPSTLCDVVTRLAGIFKALGRYGPWSPDRPSGEPTKHPMVQQMLKGYERVAFEEEGYSAAGAVPMQPPKFLALMAHLDARAADATDCCTRGLLLRDKAAFAYLWESGPRGKEVSKLVLEDFRYEDLECTVAWQDLARGKLREGATLLVEPCHGTKGRLTRHPGVVALTCGLQEDGRGTFVATVPAYAAVMEALGTPLTHWLFRSGTQTAGGTFLDTCISKQGLQQRLQRHLKAMKAYQGETLHSFRRGTAQHDNKNGEDRATLCRKRHWKGEETAELYLHPTRHLRRLVHPGADAASSSSRLAPEEGGEAAT